MRSRSLWTCNSPLTPKTKDGGSDFPSEEELDKGRKVLEEKNEANLKSYHAIIDRCAQSFRSNCKLWMCYFDPSFSAFVTRSNLARCIGDTTTWPLVYWACWPDTTCRFLPGRPESPSGTLCTTIWSLGRSVWLTYCDGSIYAHLFFFSVLVFSCRSTWLDVSASSKSVCTRSVRFIPWLTHLCFRLSQETEQTTSSWFTIPKGVNVIYEE